MTRKKETRLYKYVSGLGPSAFTYQDNIVKSLKSLFHESTAFKTLVSGYNYQYNPVFLDWLSNLKPEDLEGHFNSHEIIELLLEE